MGRTTHHRLCPLWTAPTPKISLDKRENYMARRTTAAKAAKTVEPVTVDVARKWLVDNQDKLPEGVTVAAKGKLRAAAREYYEANVGPIV